MDEQDGDVNRALIAVGTFPAARRYQKRETQAANHFRGERGRRTGVAGHTWSGKLRRGSAKGGRL